VQDDVAAGGVGASAAPRYPVKRDRRFADMSFYMMVAILMMVLLALVGIIGTWLFSQSPGPVAHPVVGHIFFQDDALGHDIHCVSISNKFPLLLKAKHMLHGYRTRLTMSSRLDRSRQKNGSASLLYAGDVEHTNLLSVVQSITVTLEDTEVN